MLLFLLLATSITTVGHALPSNYLHDYGAYPDAVYYNQEDDTALSNDEFNDNNYASDPNQQQVQELKLIDIEMEDKKSKALRGDYNGNLARYKREITHYVGAHFEHTCTSKPNTTTTTVLRTGYIYVAPNPQVAKHPKGKINFTHCQLAETNWTRTRYRKQNISAMFVYHLFYSTFETASPAMTLMIRADRNSWYCGGVFIEKNLGETATKSDVGCDNTTFEYNEWTTIMLRTFLPKQHFILFPFINIYIEYPFFPMTTPKRPIASLHIWHNIRSRLLKFSKFVQSLYALDFLIFFPIMLLGAAGFYYTYSYFLPAQIPEFRRFLGTCAGGRTCADQLSHAEKRELAMARIRGMKKPLVIRESRESVEPQNRSKRFSWGRKVRQASRVTNVSEEKDVQEEKKVPPEKKEKKESLEVKEQASQKTTKVKKEKKESLEVKKPRKTIKVKKESKEAETDAGSKAAALAAGGEILPDPGWLTVARDAFLKDKPIPPPAPTQHKRQTAVMTFSTMFSVVIHKPFFKPSLTPCHCHFKHKLKRCRCKPKKKL